MRISLVVAGSLVVACSSAPDVTPGLDLDAVARQARVQSGAPAIGVMVGGPGVDFEVAVDGVRMMGGDDAARRGDAWHWGSITKSITATLAARLVDRGDVSWDDTVGERLGAAIPDLHADYREATLKHLLSNAGGLQTNVPLERFAEFVDTPADPIADRLRFVRIALEQDPVAPPGDDFHYSNSGFIVAGAVLEAATGVSWEELLQREVFAPLEMAGVGFGAPVDVRGHVRVDGVVQPAPPMRDNPPAFGPAGRVHMPLADMARYLHAHASQRADFLSPESWATLHTPHFEAPYGLGWFRTGEATRWHHGSNTMWYAEVAIDLDRQTYAAVVVNDGSTKAVTDPVRALVRQLVAGVPPG